MIDFATCILIILTHLAYRANVKKCEISNNNSQLKCVIADVICYWSVRRVTLFLHLKDVTNRPGAKYIEKYSNTLQLLSLINDYNYITITGLVEM